MCPPAADAPPSRGPNHDPTTTPPACVPSDPTSKAAYHYAASHLHPDILNHSLRVYLHAKNLATREAIPQVEHLLFTAAIFHDIGTSNQHNGPQRFEVEGADAAKRFLLQHSVPETAAHDVWTAIALHTSPGIAERIHPLARLVRLAVVIDFKRPAALALTTPKEVGRVESLFPRGQIEKVLGDVVVEQVLLREDGSEKAPPASWAGVLVRSARENPGWEGVNRAF